MGVNERDIHELMVLQDQQFVSVHTSLDEDGETSLEDILEDPLASAFINDGFSSVEDVLCKLTEQERSVIQLRYGLADGRAYSQQEVAPLSGVGWSVVCTLARRAKMPLRV